MKIKNVLLWHSWLVVDLSSDTLQGVQDAFYRPNEQDVTFHLGPEWELFIPILFPASFG